MLQEEACSVNVRVAHTLRSACVSDRANLRTKKSAGDKITGAKTLLSSCQLLATAKERNADKAQAKQSQASWLWNRRRRATNSYLVGNGEIALTLECLNVRGRRCAGSGYVKCERIDRTRAAGRPRT